MYFLSHKQLIFQANAIFPDLLGLAKLQRSNIITTVRQDLVNDLAMAVVRAILTDLTLRKNVVKSVSMLRHLVSLWHISVPFLVVFLLFLKSVSGD